MSRQERQRRKARLRLKRIRRLAKGYGIPEKQAAEVLDGPPGPFPLGGGLMGWR